MINRRDVLRGAAASVVATAASAQETGGPFAGATARFDKANQHRLPPWAFTRKLFLPPTARPTAVRPYEAIRGATDAFGPTDAVPVGKVFHGIAREWEITPEHWTAYGCQTGLDPVAAWTSRRDHFGTIAAHDGSGAIANWGHFPVKCYKVPIVPTTAELLPSRPRARVYSYGGTVPGSTLRMRLGQPAVVRFENHLETETSVHFHGGHNPSHSDGFPSFYVLQGKSRDYFYPNILPLKRQQDGTRRPDTAESQSTCWYHDHGMDGTAYNVSKGLAGFVLVFGEEELKLIRDGVLPGLGADSCKDDELNERQDDATLEHPEYPGHYAEGKEPYHNPYDLPLVLQDKVIDPQTGQIAYDGDAHNGYLGDTFFVNGVPWPYREVENRKYRLRVLNGSNARVYRLRLLPEDAFLRSQAGGLSEAEIEAAARPFLRIGKDSWLWSHALERRDVVLAMANRADLVVDFKALTADRPAPGGGTVPGPRVFYLVDTMPQFDGRGPKEKLDDGGDPRVLPLPFENPGLPAEGAQPAVPPRRLTELRQPIALMKFVVEGAPILAEQDAKVAHGTPLIHRDPVEDRIPDHEVTVVREFIFERGKGAWQVNGRFYDPTLSNACPTHESAEEWVLRNGGGGWWHPIHIHLESHQLVRYEKDFDADEVIDPTEPPEPRRLGPLRDVTGMIPDVEVLGNHDTQILGPNTVVRIRMRFRTFTGPFVFHCHNLEHEDMRMMFNFEPVADPGGTHDPNVAPAQRTHGNDMTLGDGVGELPWEQHPVPETPVRAAGEFIVPPRRP